MRLSVGNTSGIFSRCLRQLHPLTLAFAPHLVIITRHLQSQLQKKLLHSLQNDPRYAVSFRREVRKIDKAGDGELRPLRPDRLDKSLRFRERKPADAVDPLRDDDFPRLQVTDHA